MVILEDVMELDDVWVRDLLQYAGLRQDLLLQLINLRGDTQLKVRSRLLSLRELVGPATPARPICAAAGRGASFSP